MRTELYSVRSSEEDISYINNNLRKIVNRLSQKAAVRILFKTEIDWNPKKIKADLMESLSANNPPELHIFVNAIDTKDNSSFCSLFSPFFRALEKDILKSAPPEYKKSGLYPHIQVQTLKDLPSEYPAYCFTFKRRKVLVLPEIRLMDADPRDYICQAVIAAKDLFFKMYDECPDGYIYTGDKPTSRKGKLAALLAGTKPRKEEEPADDFEAQEPLMQEEPADDFDAQEPLMQDEPADDFDAQEPLMQDEPADDFEAQEPLMQEEPADDFETQEPMMQEEPVQSESDTHEAPAISAVDIHSKASQDIIIFDEEETEPEDETIAEIIVDDEDAPLPSEEISTQAEEDPKPAKKKSGFRSFLRSFIPMKGDSPKSIFLKVIVLAAIVAFITGAFLLFKFYVIDPGVNEADMQEIQSIFYSSPTQTVTDPEGNVVATVDEVSRNWDGLKKVNDEIVGWIKVDKTKVDYPVLFHKEDNEKSQFYLYRNYKKKYSDFGSIFMDYRCADGIDSKHVILHGHNMGSDDSMFGSLLKYARLDGRTQGNTKLYKTSPIVELDTPKGNSEWVIFAVMKIDVANNNKAIFNYLQTEFDGSAQYMNFIYNIKVRSYLDVNVPINEKDRLLTLSTCSYETDNMRTIIVARELREGEDVSKYVKSVKQSTPQGTVYTDFASEYAAGNLKWYDGKGKLNGNGELEFMEQKDMFTVTFVDAKGKMILKQYVLKGEDATEPVGAPPVKDSDSKYHYTFKGWSESFKNVTKNLTIKPLYDKILKATQSPQTEPPATQAPVVQTPQTQPPTTQASTTQAPQTQATTQPPLQTDAPTEAPTLPPDPVESSATE